MPFGASTNLGCDREIQKALRELKLKSKPGDDIFIYWSGHGSSCADTGGDEEDGRDEFLVPYDGNAADAEGSMVLDDALGRWVQELDGRKVAVILDACHSGGQATGRGIKGGIKGDDSIIGSGDDLPASVEDLLKDASDAEEREPMATPLDFLDGELSRLKDIGQDDAAMLFSSASDEISAERRDGKLSVMTYFLVEKMGASSSLTLKQAYEHVRVEVRARNPSISDAVGATQRRFLCIVTHLLPGLARAQNGIRLRQYPVPTAGPRQRR